jgi:hypothetical protein
VQVEQVLDQLGMGEVGVPGVVHEDIGLLHLPARTPVEDRTRVAISWPGTTIDLVAGPTELIGFDIGDIYIVVHEQDSRHHPASFRGTVVAPT